MCLFKIINLSVKLKNKYILYNINLIIKKGEIHILTGKNGSGKSTLVWTISGNKKFKIKKGKILFKNKNINKYSINKRFLKGIFISFQENIEIKGLNNQYFLYILNNNNRKYNKKKELNIIEFKKLIYKYIKKINFSSNLLKRDFNYKFSVGEKKKNELLQIMILKPKLIILDEIDANLDKNTINNSIKLINNLKKQKKSFLIITHNKKLIKNLNINFIHKLKKHKIISNKFYKK